MLKWIKWRNPCCGGWCIALYDTVQDRIVKQVDDCYGYTIFPPQVKKAPPEEYEESSEEEFLNPPED